jgi:hypothetical protein
VGTPKENREEERASIERADATFKRRQDAFFKVHRQFYPYGNGNPTEDSMKELDEAEADWQAAQAEMDRISQEIRSGKRN